MSPLVTVIVLTYNSELYIEETLNSILNQKYQNIQLIIADDHSVDSTVSICRQWIIERSQIYNAIIVESTINRGTAYNINSALKYVLGDYIKLIAGDDIICENFLLDVMDYFDKNSDVLVLCTNICYLKENENKSFYQCEAPRFTSLFTSNKLTSQEQYNILIRFNPIFSPACIMKKDILNLINGYDERFPLCEDLFFFGQLLKKGIKIYFYDIVGIKYRIHSKSIQRKEKEILISKYEKDKMLGRSYHFFSDLTFVEQIVEYMLLYLCKIFSRTKWEGNVILRLIFKISTISLNYILFIFRYRYYLKIRNR